MIFYGLRKATQEIMGIAQVPACPTLGSTIGYFSHEFKIFSIKTKTKRDNVNQNG
jgi:hypothetical protein